MRVLREFFLPCSFFSGWNIQAARRSNELFFCGQPFWDSIAMWKGAGVPYSAYCVKLRSYLLCILFYVKTSNKSPMMVAVCST
jgi:hypothetical protein